MSKSDRTPDQHETPFARLHRKCKGQEQYELDSEGLACSYCHGWGSQKVTGCDGRRCPRSDHRMCGEKMVDCRCCAGTGLNFWGLRKIVLDYGDNYAK